MLRTTLHGVGYALGISVLVALVVIPCAYAAGERDAKSRDIVFLTDRACVGDVVLCAHSMYFNGDWRTVDLCRAKRCVRYEDVFPETRVVGPEEQR
mgnify:CR=1 FL=1